MSEGVESAWSAVVGAALLGTERRPWAGSSNPGLPPLPGGVDGLLQSAALLTVWREAGRTVAAPLLPPPAPPPTDPRPVLGPEPRRLLSTLLRDRRQAALLDEWLMYAAASGARLPGALLVDLLHVVGTDEARRASVRAFGGPLLRWLAAHNPDWAELVPPEEPDVPLELWEEAGDEARVATFRRLRATDPAAGAELLARVLPGEPAVAAVQLVESMADELSDEDAAVLEAALDDRRKRVRAAAAALLERLPASPRAQRLAALAVPALSLGGLLRRSVVVAEPAAADETQERDGVVGTPTDRLRIAVGGAALGAWEARLGRSPAELARLAWGASEPLARALVDGWTHAARQQRDVVWVRALLDAGLRPDSALLGVLEPEEADARLAAATTGAAVADLPALIAACDAPWGRQASAAAIAAVARIVARLDLSNRPDAALTRSALALKSALGPLALRLHPGTDPTPLVEAVSRGPTPSFWIDAVAGSGSTPGLAGILAFRAAMSAGFRTPTTPTPTPTPGASP